MLKAIFETFGPFKRKFLVTLVATLAWCLFSQSCPWDPFLFVSLSTISVNQLRCSVLTANGQSADVEFESVSSV
jgi:hypothetical protein